MICGAVDYFIQECQPYLRLSSSGSIPPLLHQETTPRSQKATLLAPAVGPFKGENSSASGDSTGENVTDASPLTKAYMQFINLVSLVTSNENQAKPFCLPTVPVDIDFRSVLGSHMTADRQASNVVQIVYKKPAAIVAVSGADGKGSRKISSLPISLSSFAAKVSVKDLEPSDVACVELSLSNPGSAINRFVFHFCRTRFRVDLWIALLTQNCSGSAHFSSMRVVFSCMMDRVLVICHNLRGNNPSLYPWHKWELYLLLSMKKWYFNSMCSFLLERLDNLQFHMAVKVIRVLAHRCRKGRKCFTFNSFNHLPPLPTFLSCPSRELCEAILHLFRIVCILPLSHTVCRPFCQPLS